MSLYILSDPHLSLASDKPMDVFGRRWNGYLNKLVGGWLRTVGEDDTVVLPGDISWGMSAEEAAPDLALLNALPGKKYLGRGNHDYFWNTATSMQRFFDARGFGSLHLLHNNAVYEEGAILCGTRGWFLDGKSAPKNSDYSKIAAREAGRLEISLMQAAKLKEEHPDAELLAFFHFPPVFRDFVSEELVTLLHQYGVRRVWYGHIHGVYDEPASTEYEGITFSIAAADYLGFVPLRIETKFDINS